jgi:hypothetical protein
MPRYKANAKFGPWLPGDVFESEDPFHAELAKASGVLTAVETEIRTETPEPVVSPAPSPLLPPPSPLRTWRTTFSDDVTSDEATPGGPALEIDED